MSRRDSSTFLSDQFFGTTMLLPNRNLAAAYQRVDLSLASQRYEPIPGFPALLLNFRAGLKFTVGGESWK